PLRSVELLGRLAVDAECRAEGPELEPAREELLARCSEVAADVGGPVRHPRDREAEAGGDLRGVHALRSVDVARPAPGCIPLLAGERAAREDVDALVGRPHLAPALVDRPVVLEGIGVD